MRRFLHGAGIAGFAGALAVLGTATFGQASSHREAPATSQDPTADATDVYAFVSPDAPDTVTFVANYIPDQSPASGPNFFRMGDDVLYEINIDNNGDAIEDITYQFRFRTELNPSNAFNGNTFLYNTGPIESISSANLNVRQFYSVSRMTGEGGAIREGTMIADNIPVAPYNVGPKSFPNNSYETVAMQAVQSIGTGMTVFVGPRDDPFFIDLGGTFDLLNLGSGVDYLAGKNVYTIAIQVPKNQLSANGQMPSGADDPNAIIGVRTTSYRQGVRVLRNLGNVGEGNGVFGGPGLERGPWIQVSRLDMPLVNEVIIPLKDKDRFNGSRPKNDAQFLGYVNGTAPGSTATAAPHLGALLEIVLGFDAPPAPRDDLVTAFLTGVPGLNQPASVVPSSQLRLNMAIAPAATPNRLGVVGGDNQGFPNGRRLGDDAVDIGLAVVGGVLVGQPGAAGLGDGVDANDVPFKTTFPYVASPHDYAQ